MDAAVKDVATKLKALIDQHGPSYMADEPYEAYLELRESSAVDGRTAGALFRGSIVISDANSHRALTSLEPSKSSQGAA